LAAPLPGPSGKRGAGKRRWIAFATTVEAAIVVNAGARRALYFPLLRGWRVRT